MRAHLVQLDIAWEDKLSNFAEVERLLAGVDCTPGDLIVLPEMFDTGFSTNIDTTADRDSRTLGFLERLARSSGCIVHGARTILGADGRGRNVATIVEPSGRVLCEYAKLHLFPLGNDPEAQRFTPGAGVRTYSWTHTSPASGETQALRVCPTICYDLRFPELYRVGLELGAEVFTVTSSWPSARESHRRALSIARAIENQAFVLSVNRCGRDPNLEYPGGTLAIGPRGDVLGELGSEAGVLSVEVSSREVRRWREIFPAWKDRRTVAPAE